MTKQQILKTVIDLLDEIAKLDRHKVESRILDLGLASNTNRTEYESVLVTLTEQLPYQDYMDVRAKREGVMKAKE